ncbi:hypothetical protein D047_4699B, partial [Vibrio parahaemolyticus VPTS-2010_2]
PITTAATINTVIILFILSF